MPHRLSLALAALMTVAPLASTPLAARAADDAATLHARLQAGMHAARSFVVTTTASTGFGVITTFVAPDRYRSTVNYNGTTRDVVLIGSVVYVSTAGGPYDRREAPAAVTAMQAQVLDVPVDRVLADRSAGGKTWGQFLTTSAGPQKDQRLTCTYDKASYRIDVCANSVMSLTFSRYDDPSNAVVVPSAGRK